LPEQYSLPDSQPLDIYHYQIGVVQGLQVQVVEQFAWKAAARVLILL